MIVKRPWPIETPISRKRNVSCHCKTSLTNRNTYNYLLSPPSSTRLKHITYVYIAFLNTYHLPQHVWNSQLGTHHDLKTITSCTGVKSLRPRREIVNLAKIVESGSDHPWIWIWFIFPGFGIRLFSESENIESWREYQILGFTHFPGCFVKIWRKKTKNPKFRRNLM